MIPAICRECDHEWASTGTEERCPVCASPRLVRHSELHDLGIAHLDCDAFYATVEKREHPELRDKPVIVGGGRRGVVSAACYVARLYGVRSAMPMFKALKACPDAVVLKPDMQKYAAVGRVVRDLMRQETPLVEPLSIDEAFLDLTDPAQSPATSPARRLVTLVRRIEREVGVTASIGLSYNKFLAKLASDLDKPRGFAVIGRAEALSFLGPRPVGDLWGVGKAMQVRLRRDGIGTIGDVRQKSEPWLVAHYGRIGHRLWQFAHGRDDRSVEARSPTKSVSTETTFDTDVAVPGRLRETLQGLSDRVAARLAEKRLAAGIVVLKLKTAGFRIITRSHALPVPTGRSDRLFQVAAPMLDAELGAGPFRLIGIGASGLVDAVEGDPPDLLEEAERNPRLAQATRAVAERHGREAVVEARDIENRSPKEEKGAQIPLFQKGV